MTNLASAIHTNSPAQVICCKYKKWKKMACTLSASFFREDIMTDVQKKRFSLIGCLLMSNYVSVTYINTIHIKYLIVLIYIFSVGIGWTDNLKTAIKNLTDFELEESQFPLKFTFDIDHTSEMFTQPVVGGSGRHKSFTCFLLNEAAPELEWQRFECSMSFPQCHYDWCVTGDNNIMVIMSDIHRLFLFTLNIFFFL